MNDETNDPDSDQRGSTKVELWLAGVTGDDLEATVDAIAGLLVERGYNNEDGESPIAVLAVFACGLPAEPDELAADLMNRGAVAIMVPGDPHE